MYSTSSCFSLPSSLTKASNYDGLGLNDLPDPSPTVTTASAYDGPELNILPPPSSLSMEGYGKELSLNNEAFRDPSSLPRDTSNWANVSTVARKRRNVSSSHGSELSLTVGPKRSSLMACLNCRRKKRKCHRVENSCDHCRKLEIECVLPDADERLRPSSKTYIYKLQSHITTLEAELTKANEETAMLRAQLAHQDEPLVYDIPVDELSYSKLDMICDSQSDLPSNLIARLCARSSHLHKNEAGQLQYFGPTSSLHTSESTISSFVQWGEYASNGCDHGDSKISEGLKRHLLEHYWKFHSNLPIVHREAFLHDMKSGRCRYYSKALLYAMLACAAGISENPALRALTLSSKDDDSRRPFLLEMAQKLVEVELENNAGITTIQSLQILGKIYSCLAEDSKGWMECGRATRLLFELGLHKDARELQAAHMTQMDLEVRQVVFLGCFLYDRGWALYLGRPHSIKLDDASMSMPSKVGASFRVLLMLAYVELLDALGELADSLNATSITMRTIKHHNKQLLTWRSNLDPSLHWHEDCHPGVTVLHMQFCSGMTLLHRSTAKYGTSDSLNNDLVALRARKICSDYAIELTRMVNAYRAQNGSAITFTGIAPYSLTMGTIVLIANQCDHPSFRSNEQLMCIDNCLQAIEELQVSYKAAHSILKQLKYLMLRCKMQDVKTWDEASSSVPLDSGPQIDINGLVFDDDSPPVDVMGHLLPAVPTEGEVAPVEMGQEFLPTIGDCEALYSMAVWNIMNPQDSLTQAGAQSSCWF